MNPEDFKKQKRIEAVFVRNYVDTSKIDVDVIGDSALIRGDFYVFEYSPEGHKMKDPTEARGVMKKTCMTIEQEIRRMGEVTSISWQLKNWEKSGSNWTKKKAGS